MFQNCSRSLLNRGITDGRHDFGLLKKREILDQEGAIFAIHFRGISISKAFVDFSPRLSTDEHAALSLLHSTLDPLLRECYLDEIRSLQLLNGLPEGSAKATKNRLNRFANL